MSREDLFLDTCRNSQYGFPVEIVAPRESTCAGAYCEG